MTIAQLTAKHGICEILVKAGIAPDCFLWHVQEDHPEGKTDKQGNILKIFEVYEAVGASYKPGELIPAWTFEELYIMIGGDHLKPDLLPDNEVQVLNDDKAKKPYFNYLFTVPTDRSIRTWQKDHSYGEYSQGAQAMAELLRDHISRGSPAEQKAKIKIINERYKYFFNEK